MSTDRYKPHTLRPGNRTAINRGVDENATTKEHQTKDKKDASEETTKNFELEKTRKLESDSELTERLKAASSFRVHLSNVICGINHEVTPWLGSMANIAERLKILINKKNINPEVLITKLDKILEAAKQASNILSMLSGSVKKLQTYSNVNAPIIETVNSWIKLILTDRIFKNLISENNIIIDDFSLDFDADHSPMLLSQIILNLAKNSVEHNADMLEDLKIQLYGDTNKKYLIYEDNGKGIHPDILANIFSPGITSKNNPDSHNHGFGLSACMDYCVAMGASIWAKSELGRYTRFVIKFEKTYEDENSKAILKQRVADSGFIDLDGFTSTLNVYHKKQENKKEEELW